MTSVQQKLASLTGSCLTFWLHTGDMASLWRRDEANQQTESSCLCCYTFTIQTPIARVTRFKYSNNETDYRLLQGICLLSATANRVISVRKKLLISMHGKLTVFHSPGRPPAATVATAASSEVSPNSSLHYKCSLVIKFVILCDITDTSVYKTFDIHIKRCKHWISLQEYYVTSGSSRAMKSFHGIVTT